MEEVNSWTREEHILAFNLYCKIPFSKINATYQPVKDLAAILGRTNGSVAMKLANFARLDPDLKARKISGLTQGAKGEEIVWNEFQNNWEELAYESERILAAYQKGPIEQRVLNSPIEFEGKEREVIIKQRVNQIFFRQMILASYNNTCCISGSRTIDFLNACHIKPWKNDLKNAMNPHNGLCMNVLYHTAFDKGLFTITENYEIVLSDELRKTKDPCLLKMFMEYDHKKINLPQRFYPGKDFLLYHYNTVYRK